MQIFAKAAPGATASSSLCAALNWNICPHSRTGNRCAPRSWVCKCSYTHVHTREDAVAFSMYVFDFIKPLSFCHLFNLPSIGEARDGGRGHKSLWAETPEGVSFFFLSLASYWCRRSSRVPTVRDIPALAHGVEFLPLASTHLELPLKSPVEHADVPVIDAPSYNLQNEKKPLISRCFPSP